jgi:hypothetical protein
MHLVGGQAPARPYALGSTDRRHATSCRPMHLPAGRRPSLTSSSLAADVGASIVRIEDAEARRPNDRGPCRACPPNRVRLAGAPSRATPMLAVKLFGRPRPGRDHANWSLKQAIDRTLDVAIATVAIGFILPLAGLVSLLIFLEDPGPILTRHRGVYVNGRQFDILRFRTQLVDADTRLEEYLTRNRDEYVRYYLGEPLHHDPRFSVVGSVLYRTGLDDIPILVNVVGGQLPIVGHYSWRQVLAWLRAQLAVEPDHLG